MSILKDTANQLQFGQAGPGANPEDTCSLENMQVKVRYPAKHSENVLDEHLGFSNIIVPVGHQHVMAPVADIGTTVAAMQTSAYPGTNLSIVCGVMPQVSDPEAATPGNSPFRHVQDRKKLGAGTKIPPRSKRNGQIFEIVEKGVEHSMSVLNGLPSHGALNMLAGLKFEGMNSISTAKEQFEKVLTSDMLGKLPGMNFSMGNLKDLLSGDQLKEITKNMPTSVQEGFNNALQLMQTADVADAGGFMSGNKINPQVFVQNAVEKLKNVKTVHDLTIAMHQLESNTALHGMDAYANVEIEIEGAFGNVKQKLTSSGGVDIEIPDVVRNLQEAFSGLMGQLPGAGGSSGGMFDQSKLKDMFNRLPTGEQRSFIEQMQNNVASGGNPRSLLNNLLSTALDNKTFPFT